MGLEWKLSFVKFSLDLKDWNFYLVLPAVQNLSGVIFRTCTRHLELMGTLSGLTINLGSVACCSIKVEVRWEQTQCCRFPNLTLYPFESFRFDCFGKLFVSEAYLSVAESR